MVITRDKSDVLNAADTSPPSRFTNPFATCWTKPGAMEFHFPQGESAAGLVERLCRNGWWGAVVGPHGAGKSALLEALKPRLLEQGCDVASITLRDGQRNLPQNWLARALASTRPILVLDGYEQLSAASRVWLRWRCRRAAAGLVITSHEGTNLPLLIELLPTRAVVVQLVNELTRRISSPVTPADAAASFDSCGGNVREVLFDLYALHEMRTCAARAAYAVGA